MRKCPKNTEVDIEMYSEKHLVSIEFLDITYSRYLKMLKLIDYNKENGFLVESERETKRLIRLVELYLLPELEELENELKNREQHEILIEYPNLIDVVSNLDTIKKEVEL